MVVAYLHVNPLEQSDKLEVKLTVMAFAQTTQIFIIRMEVAYLLVTLLLYKIYQGDLINVYSSVV